MEMRCDNILLKFEGSSNLNRFILRERQAIFVFPPFPLNGNVRFISSNKNIFYCPKEPCWVRCVAYDIDKTDLQLINENIELFYRMGVFSYKDEPINQNDIDQLDGGDVRLLNILICRLKKESFLEVNIVGLTLDSVRRILRFIIDDITYNIVTYVIVEYTDLVKTNANPIFISNDNIEDILNVLDK